MLLPSKKIIYLLVACIFTVSLISYANKNTEKTQLVDLAVTSGPADEDTSKKDSDNDNLPDWKEALLGTNLSKADTDGDGTKDGDEINQDRDPLKAGPNDSLVATTTTNAKIAETPNTMTNVFVRDFFGKFLQTQNSGSIDTQTKEALVQSMLEQYSGTTTIADHFYRSDLVTSSTLDREKIKQYGNAFVTVEESGVREANTLSQSSSETNNLVLVGTSYKKLANNLSKIIVPEALASVHLAIINNYYALGETLEQITKSTEDPVKIVYLIRQLQDSQSGREPLYTVIALFIKNNGIIFNNDEPGHYWITLVQ